LDTVVIAKLQSHIEPDAIEAKTEAIEGFLDHPTSPEALSGVFEEETRVMSLDSDFLDDLED